MVYSVDDGQEAFCVAAERIFFICMEALYNLSAVSFPHQHFITTCKNRCDFFFFPKAVIFFFSFPLLQGCSLSFLVAYWFSAVETCSFLSQVLPLIPGLWYLLLDTAALWSMEASCNVNTGQAKATPEVLLQSFNPGHSLPGGRWEIASRLVADARLTSALVHICLLSSEIEQRFAHLCEAPFPSWECF